jgi:hypothetical protein
MSTQFKGYVGIYEYAKATGHSVKHIYEQIRLGKIPAKKMGNRGVWQIARSILEAALAKVEK